MPGTRWFPEASLNFAENLLRRQDSDPAIIYRDESGIRLSVSWRELSDAVDRVSSGLHALGLTAGDRVAAMAPNGVDTIVAMLATARLGGVWSSCSPDFGVSAVIDRFAQIEPRFLFACENYQYNGKRFDCAEKISAVASSLPTLEQHFVFKTPSFDRLREHNAEHLPFVQMPFDAPLYILFSSGTTGVPKCIVHSAGGTLLQHKKEHLLHCDLHKDERLFFFTTCGWMMWNWLVSALASGGTLCLYDGSPIPNDPGILWRYVEEEKIQHFGTSPGYLSALAKAGYYPAQQHDLNSLRSILSTGSPLPAESFYWVKEHLADVRLSSITGGTDIISCFALGNPTLPVFAGEIQSLGLGMDVAFYNEAGAAVVEEKGELVCRRSFPSMPIGFWKDAHNRKYMAAYFETYPGVWHHGDYGEITAHGGVIIYGRSDAVLNRGGIRIGTAEIYRQVEKVDQVLESIAVTRHHADEDRIILFVRLKPNTLLDDQLTQTIKRTIRNGTSPRHVPDLVVAVEDLPRTRSGKLVEIAVRDLIAGADVKNVGALANPECLEYFRTFSYPADS